LKLFSSIPGMEITAMTADAGNMPESSSDGVKPVTVDTRGCHYIDLCPLRGRECAARDPQLETVHGSHKVACFKISN
ncbi:MAG: hypothetical protein JRF32_10130, partial [Deltaproteobacteria bacterium]|nr:hypothetical protein [Deltaproteobacteria bacterium]